MKLYFHIQASHRIANNTLFAEIAEKRLCDFRFSNNLKNTNTRKCNIITWPFQWPHYESSSWYVSLFVSVSYGLQTKRKKHRKRSLGTKVTECANIFGSKTETSGIWVARVLADGRIC